MPYQSEDRCMSHKQINHAECCLDIEALYIPVLQKTNNLLGEKLAKQKSTGISAAHLPQPTTIPLSKHTFCMTLY